ncbi:MAG TPA: hypothetical protein VMU26_03640 [Candidatus Polarisedimenticolia bacterium]|nr:hypothetical protein [Candidatus Polarisedimenticolia bacterium]
MDKVDALFLHSSVEHMGLTRVFGKTCSDSDVQIHDKRVAQLLVLLQQLDESAEGLGALPEPELGEIVCSAIRVCGFVDPIEARDMIAIVLDAIEMQELIPEEAASKALGIALSDA